MARSNDNDSFYNAQYIGDLGSDLDVSGSLGTQNFFDYFSGFDYYVDRVDYFKFEVNSDRNVIISNDENDVSVRLYDDRYRYIGKLTDDSYGGDYANDKGYEEGLAISLPRGDYYLQVSGGYDFTNYQLDFDAETDDDFLLEDARKLGTIDCSKRVNGRVGALDFGDAYRFRPGRSGDFTIGQTGSAPRGEMKLYDEDGDLIERDSNQIREDLDDDRDYYLRVYAEDAAETSRYQLNFIPNPLFKGTNRNDRLQGCKDDEIFRGLKGDDLLIGEAGDDQLIGAIGDDRLLGRAGNDQLNGGRGFDVLFGGQGRDIFMLLSNNNGDRIRDFQDGFDQLDLPNGISFDRLNLRQQGDNTVIRSGNSVLATLTGVNATQITAIDFR